ncbi:MAG: hypothetical protein U0641_03460 [Anaerolineae bacterium]
MPAPSDHLQSPARYHSFLVRLWQDGAGGPWRASAHCVQTGDTLRFASVEAMFAYLAERLGVPLDAASGTE